MGTVIRVVTKSPRSKRPARNDISRNRVDHRHPVAVPDGRFKSLARAINPSLPDETMKPF